jgi:3-oxoacyl-[acyl-carrier-protein] synthase II
MHRIFAKGPRLASPAEFPNLVPSAPVGHVSIYLGLRGPVLAVSELGAAGECAAMQAAELVAAGEADVIVAADVEEPHGLLARVVSALYGEPLGVPDRAEAGGAAVFEAEEHAAARGARVMARVVAIVSWRDGDPPFALPAPGDPSRAHVVVPRESPALDAALASSAWSRVPRVACDGAGSGANGATALAVAARRVATGESREALVLGIARGRGYAVLLAAP